MLRQLDTCPRILELWNFQGPKVEYTDLELYYNIDKEFLIFFFFIIIVIIVIIVVDSGYSTCGPWKFQSSNCLQNIFITCPQFLDKWTKS